MVPLPTGGTELANLKTGDVLGIYDFAVFVTEASGSGSFSGKGLVRLPFLEGTLALAEFSGVKAIRSDDGNGGCVYEATNFRLLNVPQSEVAAAKSKLLSTLAQQTDPAAYAGTLAGALAGYETISDTASLFCTYTTAILQASEEIRKALVDAGGDPSGGGTPDPRITEILTDLKTITDQLTAGSPKVDSITQKYQDLISKLDALTKDSPSGEPGSGPGNPVFAIRNVVVSAIDNVSARINWELSGGTASKYIIEYQDKDGAILQETVTSPLINLSRLREGMAYKYRILAYDGDKVIATYGQDVFQTIKRSIGNPQNLQYAPKTDDSKVVRITWDANKDHRTYKLVYVDQNGIENTVYPTTNQVDIGGLDRNRSYPYRIMAYGDDGLFSEEVPGQFNVGTVCEISLVASSLRVMPGTPVTLTVYGCADEFNKPGVVEWLDGSNATIGRTEDITVTPQATTTYKVTCILDKILENGQKEHAGCSKQEMVIVEKKCEGVTAMASAVSIEQGEPVMLKSTGCTGKIEWKDELTTDKILGSLNNLIVYPAKSKSYVLSCTDGNGNKCFAETEKVEVKCAFRLALSNNSNYSGLFGNSFNKEVIIKAVGCPGKVEWKKEGGNWGIETYYLDESTVEYRSIKKKFTVTATCKATGCTAGTGTIEVPPTSNFCYDEDDFKIERVDNNINTLTLKVKSDHAFKWDDNGSQDQVRTFDLPSSTAVFSVTMTEKNCKAAFAYEPNHNPITQLPCNELSLSKSGEEKILYAASSTKLSFQASGCDNGVKSYPIIWKKKDVNGNTEATLEGTGETQNLTFTNADVGKSFVVSATCQLTEVTKSVKVNITKEGNPGVPTEKLQNPCNFIVYTPYESSYNTFLAGEEIKINVLGAGSGLSAYVVGDSHNISDKSPSINPDKTVISLRSIFGIDKNGAGTYYGSFYVKVINTVQGAGSCETSILINVKPNRTNDPYYSPYTIDLSAVKNKEDCGKYLLGKEIPIIKLDQGYTTRVLKYGNSLLDFGVISLYEDFVGKVYDGTTAPERIGLVDKVCHARGGKNFEWFRGKNQNGLTSPMPIEKYSGYYCGVETSPDYKNTVTYYSRCTFNDGTFCVNEVKVNPFMPSGARVGVTEDEQASSGLSALPCQYSKQAAVQTLLSNLLCDKLAILEGDEKSKLEAVRNALLAQGIQLAAITDAMVADLVVGKCSEVVGALTANIEGNESAATLNGTLVNQQNIDKLLSDVVDALPASPTDVCVPPPASLVELTSSGGRIAGYDIDYNRFFIAPDGRAVKLPMGAKPKFSNFGNGWGAPPTGTLQGFVLADGTEYFAEIINSPEAFVNYILKTDPICRPAKVYDQALFQNPAGVSPVYYLQPYNGSDGCGYNWVEMNYTFAPNSNGSLIAVDPGLGGSYKNITRFKCAEEGDWVTGADGTKRKTVTIAGSKFSLEDKGGDITVKGEWKNFAKCPECKETAETALQSALTKARAKNSGKLTEQTTVVESKTMTYGPAGDVVYADMKLGDILTNLAETYNSLLEKARVPVEAWEPGKQFYVRDETAVISGAIDQGLEELKDIPELVGLGLTLVSDPDGAHERLKTFAQDMDWEKAKSIGVEIARAAVFADEFEKGREYALHATGRAGVVIAKTVMVAGATLVVVLQDAPSELKKASDILKDWIVDLTKIKKINGRFPINSQMYAGKKFSFDVDQNLPLQAKNAGVISGSTKTRMDGLHAKYPDGVDFNELGFARFEPYTVKVNGVKAEVKVKTNGNRNADFTVADQLLGINEDYRIENGFVWHHVEDMETMILLPKDIHTEVKHTGGIAVLKNDITIED